MTLASSIAVTLAEYAIWYNNAQSEEERSEEEHKLKIVTRFLEESDAMVRLHFTNGEEKSRKIESVFFACSFSFNISFLFPTLNVHPRILKMWKYGYIGTPSNQEFAMMPISWATAKVLLDHHVTVYSLSQDNTANFVNNYEDIKYNRANYIMMGVHFDTIQYLWDEFGDVPMDPETECIESDWLIFPAGTHREEVWSWFEDVFPVSVAEDLMHLS